MKNPFAGFSTRDWLYAGGAVASLVAIAYIVARQNNVPGVGNVQSDNVPAATTSDVLNSVAPTPLSPYSYNVTPVGYTPPVASGADMAPSSGEGCTCAGNSDCAGSQSALATGDAFSSLDALLQYYQNTNPIYLQLQQTQLEQYAAYFAQGESYSGNSPVGVSPAP